MNETTSPTSVVENVVEIQPPAPEFNPGRGLPAPDNRLEAVNTVKFLHESGLLYVINRTVLHPLGMALIYINSKDHGVYPQALQLVVTKDGSKLEFDEAHHAKFGARYAELLKSLYFPTEPGLAIAE